MGGVRRRTRTVRSAYAVIFYFSSFPRTVSSSVCSSRFFLGSFSLASRGFLRSSDFRIFPGVAASSQLAQPGWKPCHLGCPRVPASRQLAHPGWKPCHLMAGSTTTSLARQEQLCSAVPLGQPFVLHYEVYATTTSTSSGALRWIPRGTQGLSKDTQCKGFSFWEELRSASRCCRRPVVF